MTRTDEILAMLKRQSPNGLSSAQIRQRFPGVRAKYIQGALYRMEDDGRVFRAEVFGVKMWFAQTSSQQQRAA